LTVLNDAVKRARSNQARRAAKSLWEKKRDRAPDISTYPANVLRIGSTPGLGFELHTQEVIVPPDKPALAHSLKIIERQLEIQWQDC
jgi:hypothetical protein